MTDVEAVAADVVDAAIKIHMALGPGLLESAYQHCMAHEMKRRGRRAITELILPVIYEDQQVDAGYRIDMLIDDIVVIENKAVETILPIHQAQLLTYLKLSGRNLGFLLNWNVRLMKQGIQRVVFNLPGPSSYPKIPR